MPSSIGMIVLEIIRDHGGMKEERDSIPDHPLTRDEIRETRRVLRDAAYSRRFWSTVRTWASWLAGSVIFALTFWDKIKAYVPTSFFPWG